MREKTVGDKLADVNDKTMICILLLLASLLFASITPTMSIVYILQILALCVAVYVNLKKYNIGRKAAKYTNNFYQQSLFFKIQYFNVICAIIMTIILGIILFSTIQKLYYLALMLVILYAWFSIIICNTERKIR